MDNNAVKNNLLIVEDDPSNILELSHILRPLYQVNAAKDGETALQYIKKYMPDLILLDIIMPGISGYDVLAELQGSEDTKEIPVIFITGLRNSDDERRGLVLGAVDYICKPFDEVIVRHRVSNQMLIVNLQRELEIAKNTVSSPR